MGSKHSVETRLTSKLHRLAVFATKRTINYNQQHQTDYAIRIGINSGPVVAGVIGTKKFSFDLWGETVNMASRIDSLGVPNQIQVTETMYELLRGQYTLEERGEIEIKGKGTCKTYFLKGPI